jgi:hypothetical protein
MTIERGEVWSNSDEVLPIGQVPPGAQAAIAILRKRLMSLVDEATPLLPEPGDDGTISDEQLAAIDGTVTAALDECYTLIGGLRGVRRIIAGIAVSQRPHGRGAEVAKILGKPRQRLPRRGAYTNVDAQEIIKKVRSANEQLNQLINRLVIQTDDRSATALDVR